MSRVHIIDNADNLTALTRRVGTQPNLHGDHIDSGRSCQTVLARLPAGRGPTTPAPGDLLVLPSDGGVPAAVTNHPHAAPARRLSRDGRADTQGGRPRTAGRGATTPSAQAHDLRGGGGDPLQPEGWKAAGVGVFSRPQNSQGGLLPVRGG